MNTLATCPDALSPWTKWNLRIGTVMANRYSRRVNLKKQDDEWRPSTGEAWRASWRKGEQGQEPIPLMLAPPLRPRPRIQPSGALHAAAWNLASTSGAMPMSLFRNSWMKSGLRVLLRRRCLWNVFAPNAFRPVARQWLAPVPPATARIMTC